MQGVLPDGTPDCVVDQDTTFDGGDFALSGQSCPTGQIMNGIDANRNITCRTLNTLVRDYVDANCFLYVGSTDSCELRQLHEHHQGRARVERLLQQHRRR